jgi:hypothetical protein
VLKLCNSYNFLGAIPTNLLQGEGRVCEGRKGIVGRNGGKGKAKGRGREMRKREGQGFGKER